MKIGRCPGDIPQNGHSEPQVIVTPQKTAFVRKRKRTGPDGKTGFKKQPQIVSRIMPERKFLYALPADTHTGMASAAPLGDKKGHSAFGCRGNGLVITFEKTVVGTACQQCTLIGTDSFSHIRKRNVAVAKDRFKLLPHCSIGIEPCLYLSGCHIHLERGLYRAARLLLNIFGPAIPELCFCQGGIEHGRGVQVMWVCSAVITDSRRQIVITAFIQNVAARTVDSIVT
ncbi:hypothetical protein MNB_SV-10-1149 [hydrothermal vent metagenome]|uniref:Uncharacterized protein n=1 Tax=hydrothermal vent metagenome TaxID=652676 RepID=A0A1W1C705_9ZZZZ